MQARTRWLSRLVRGLSTGASSLVALAAVGGLAIASAEEPAARLEAGAPSASRVFSISGPHSTREPGAALRELSLVRFLKELPFTPVAIGPRPRLPYEGDPAMGLAFVYYFGKLR